MNSDLHGASRKRYVLTGYGFVICSFLVLGTGVPVSKDAVAIIPVWPFTAVTLAIGFLFMLPFARWIDDVRWGRIPRADYLKMAFQALLAAILYTVFLLYGLQRTTAVTAAVVNSVTPALVLVLSMALLGERLTLRKLFAILMAIAAVAIMSTVTSVDGGAAQSTALGVFLVLLSGLSLAVFLVYAKHLSAALPPTTLATGLLGAAFLMSLPLGIHDGLQFNWTSVDRKSWLETLYYGVAIWAIPFWTTYLGIARIPASAAGMATAITPVTAVITAVAFYGERFTWQAGVALVLILVSICVAEIRDSAPSES